MAGYRAVRNRVYVWAAPCPDCKAGKDKPCQDMRTGVRATLYGRRTHKGRREAVKAMGNPKVRPTMTTLRPARRPVTGQLQITGVTTGHPWTQDDLREPNVVTGEHATWRHYGGRAWDVPVMNTATTNFTTTVAEVGQTLSTAGWTVVNSDQVWQTWNDIQYRETGAIVYNDQQAARSWVRWVETGTTSQVYTHEQIYRGWVTDDAARQVFEERVRQQEADLQRRRDAMQADRERRNRERLAREQELMENRLLAHARSTELLLMLLTEAQRIEWRDSQQVTVLGSAGGRYVIEGHRDTVHGNIVQVDEHGCRLARLCVAPEMWDEDGAMPTPDGWVGQLMAIRHNEEVLRRNANFSHRGRCLNPDPALTQMLRDDRIIAVA